MNLFDLHCDTAFALYKKRESLLNGNCHISLEKAKKYGKYNQVMAIWSQHSISVDEQWTQYHAILDNLHKELEKNPGVVLCKTADRYKNAMADGKHAFILGIEGGDLLDSEIWRLDELFEAGVRVLTLTWKDENCIGGAHNTSKPLTAFGKRVVSRSFQLGISVDVSHSSAEVTDECIAMAQKAGKPIIASHSNSFAVCPHPRNLTDERAKAIAATGGIIGVSLCPPHLRADGNASMEDVLAHICHYADIGLSKSVCLGCDLDGTELPIGFESIADLEKLSDALKSKGYPQAFLDDFFFENANRYFSENLTRA